jgi:ABC-type transporter Mla subunit MlaD
MKRFGKFLLIYGALMAFLLYSLPTCKFQSKTRYVVAASTASIETGNNVKYKNLVVGRITSVDTYNDSLLISYKLQRQIKLPDNYIAAIHLNALGNNYLDLSKAGISSNLKIRDTLRATVITTPGFDSAKVKKWNEAIQMVADMLKQPVDTIK